MRFAAGVTARLCSQPFRSTKGNRGSASALGHRTYGRRKRIGKRHTQDIVVGAQLEPFYASVSVASVRFRQPTLMTAV